MNSFWGKWGQRDCLPQTTVVKNRSDLLKILTDPGVEVDELMPVSESTMFVSWHDLKEAVSPHPYTNVVIAAFVTAQARLKLYSYLELLGERALYFDTDSVIYTQKPGEPTIETGEFLGDMADELSKFGQGSFIEEFVSGGPKNYGFKVNNGASDSPTVCKVRGLTINYRTLSLVNFEVLKEMVTKDEPPTVVPFPKKIARPKLGMIVTQPQKKTFRVVYSKRRRVADYDTLPFGTKRRRTN